MARSLARRRDREALESKFAAEFEAAELLTLEMIYEKNSRFAGGAYSSFLKKVDRFSDRPLAASLREREGHAARLEEIDGTVKRIISALQARGFKSPYLRSYVVARINPVRFHKMKKGDTKPPMPIAAALTRMTAAAKSSTQNRFDGRRRPRGCWRRVSRVTAARAGHWVGIVPTRTRTVPCSANAILRAARRQRPSGDRTEPATAPAMPGSD